MTGQGELFAEVVDTLPAAYWGRSDTQRGRLYHPLFAHHVIDRLQDWCPLSHITPNTKTKHAQRISELKIEMRDRGIPFTIINVTLPTVRLVDGEEVREVLSWYRLAHNENAEQLKREAQTRLNEGGEL